MNVRPKIVVLFDNLGPYHVARIRALGKYADLTVIEVRNRSREYLWNRVDMSNISVLTLLSEQDSERAVAVRLTEALGSIQPLAVLVPGWSSPAALIALDWCGRHNVSAIVMSASQKIDFRRSSWREWIKKCLLSHVSGALVGGSPHLQYAASLGIPDNRILFGYDVVDNEYFELGAARARSGDAQLQEILKLPRPFLLASARFVEKKNLPRLIDAYGAARKGEEFPDLVLMGDGPLRREIEGQIRALRLDDSVHLPGFVQYSDLPKYYGLALAFVHASTTEQWGLVVNEAMASGLPVIVSNACGCATDLVEEGINGFTFHPQDTARLASLLCDFAKMSPEMRCAMGDASRRIIAQWTPETFARNARHLVELSLSNPRRPYRLLGRTINSLALRFQV